LAAAAVAVLAVPSFGGSVAAGSADMRLVMFEEPGCPWCRRWHQEVGPGYPHTAEGRRAPLVSIDGTRQAPPGVTLAAPIGLVPTFVLVDGGREVGRITGYPGAEFFWPMLGELMQRSSSSAGPPSAPVVHAKSREQR
jgi:hypothetical protein